MRYEDGVGGRVEVRERVGKMMGMGGDRTVMLNV